MICDLREILFKIKLLELVELDFFNASHAMSILYCMLKQPSLQLFS